MEGFTLGAEIRKAAYTVQHFTSGGLVSDKDKRIPQKLLAKAKVNSLPSRLRLRLRREWDTDSLALLDSRGWCSCTH